MIISTGLFIKSLTAGFVKTAVRQQNLLFFKNKGLKIKCLKNFISQRRGDAEVEVKRETRILGYS